MKKWISMVLCLLLLVNLALPVFAEPEPSPQPDETPAVQSAPAAPTPAPEEEPEATPAPSEEPQAAAPIPAPETEPEQDAASRYKESAVQTDADGFIRGTEEGSDYWWKLDDNGTLTIKGTKMGDYLNQEYGYSVVPWPTANGKITRVVVQNGIQYVGSGAFWELTTVQSVSLPSGLVAIGDQAMGCRDLESIIIPEGVVTIGDHALNGGAYTSIHIPASVREIGIRAFGTGTAIKSLTEITVDPKNPNFCSINGALYTKDGSTLLQAPDAITGEFVISDGVTIIKREAFTECWDLAGIIIPASVKTIENNVFNYTPGVSRYIQFLGSAPEMVERPETGQFHDGSSGTFTTARATVYYPQNDPSWAEVIIKDYGGTLTWIAYDPAEPLPFKKEVTPLPDSGFKVEGNVLFGLSPQMNIAALQAKIENGAQIIVKDAKGNLLASDKAVGTGCTVGFGSDGTTGQVQVVVRGDVSGDGDVKVQDVIAVRQQILNIKPLEGVYLQASLIKSKVEPKVLDVIEMRKFILQIIDTLN